LGGGKGRRPIPAKGVKKEVIRELNGNYTEGKEVVAKRRSSRCVIKELREYHQL